MRKKGRLSARSSRAPRPSWLRLGQNWNERESRYRAKARAYSKNSGAAYDGGASYVVSGDRHLLKIRSVKGIRIVTVSEMLQLL